MEAEASSRDLLQRFAGSTALCDSLPPHLAVALVAGGEDVELSLSLSLGGCFSSNPREKANKLIRSSSISSFPFLDSKDENFPVAPTPLHRTCSLPVLGNDEDYRKRKELQTRKRLEAKRKRSEKRNSSRGEEGSWLPPRPPTSQRSIGSVASSSSGGGSMQGFDIVRVSNCSEAKSSLPDHTSPRPSANDNTLRKLGRRHSGMGNMERSSLPDHTARGLSAKENTLKKLERRHSGMGETESDIMKTSTKEEMPCVSTQGNGPNGKRIEGFLYKYRNGEELRIVCVCHGSFLTPSEFVRHAGGGDVDHPLRHIVVNPLSPFL